VRAVRHRQVGPLPACTYTPAPHPADIRSTSTSAPKTRGAFR
jgi:hypothetical protein